jgi:hypothetical protein
MERIYSNGSEKKFLWGWGKTGRDGQRISKG